MSKGTVFNIQRFSIHDGPGIRTTVFLKGCPLKCLWCSNPESQSSEPQLMLRFSKCRGCGKCIDACQENAITISKEGQMAMNWQKCRQCFDCTKACLYGARSVIGTEMTVDEVMKEVLSDAVFYKNSGGGITLSGGEPLQQIDFTVKLLEESRARGIHTCLETTGLASETAIQSVTGLVDLFLYDIKHPDGGQHLQFTGVRNDRILRHLSLVSEKAETWIRVPLTAGLNDSPEIIEQIIDLAQKSGVRKISLLPYHEGGLSKSRQIGVKYKLPEAVPPSQSHLAYLSNLISDHGMEVTIGS